MEGQAALEAPIQLMMEREERELHEVVGDQAPADPAICLQGALLWEPKWRPGLEDQAVLRVDSSQPMEEECHREEAHSDADGQPDLAGVGAHVAREHLEATRIERYPDELRIEAGGQRHSEEAGGQAGTC